MERLQSARITPGCTFTVGYVSDKLKIASYYNPAEEPLYHIHSRYLISEVGY
jgi:hypothetical protein